MKKNKTMWWILGAAALIVIAIILLCGSGAFVLFLGYRNVSPVAEERMQLWADGDVDAIYDTTSRGWRRMDSEEEILGLFERLDGALGPPQSWTLNSFNMRSSTDGTTAVAVYNVSFENASGTVTWTLMKEGGAWKTHGVNVNSPGLLPGAAGEADEEDVAGEAETEPLAIPEGDGDAEAP